VSAEETGSLMHANLLTLKWSVRLCSASPSGLNSQRKMAFNFSVCFFKWLTDSCSQGSVV